MSIDYRGFPISKGTPRKVVRKRMAKADLQRLKEFRDAVWKREIARVGGGFVLYEGFWSFCQLCDRMVSEGALFDSRGHVHHVVSRRDKTKRYDPDNGVLLCRKCHTKRHGREF